MPLWKTHVTGNSLLSYYYMTASNTNITYKLICRLLEKKQLKEAIEEMLLFSEPLQIWQLSDKVKGLQSNYQMMLNYSFEGVKDPEQKKLYNSLISNS